MQKKFFIKSNQRLNGEYKLLKWFKKNKLKVKIGLIIFVTFFATVAVSLWTFWDIPLLSPIDSLTTFMFLSKSQLARNNQKIVYGFLPYWNTGTYTTGTNKGEPRFTIQKELTHLGYFSLTLGADGSFVSSVDGELDMGLHRLNSDAFATISNDLDDENKKLELVVSQFNHGDISYFLNSENAQDNFIQSLDNVFLAYPFSGINIDIETSGETDEKMRQNLTNFIIKLRKHLDEKYGHVQLSIDMYAGAAANQQIWNIKDLAPHVDYIVVMAYDFHRSSSSVAGPVAPLFGGKELWDGDINYYLQEFLKIVPSEKILLGIPFYGYEWQTTSRDSQSHTFPDTGATASYKRVLEILEKKDELQVQEHWNEEALSPYISYIENGEIYVIYYENSRSISYKLDYVNQLDLGGVAIWALGYEGNSRELWDVIERKVNIWGK
jgi:spore germination protein YaaH